MPAQAFMPAPAAPLSTGFLPLSDSAPTSTECLDPTEADWRMLAPESVTTERISGWMLSGPLILAGGVVLAIILLTNAPSAIWTGLWIGLYGLAAAVLVWAAQFLPSLAYRHTRYRLSSVGFEIRRGILWRSRITVPHARVQHTDVAQGPLQRFYDLGKLIVYTAGTQHASVELDGLPFQVACELRDVLVGRREANDGV